MWILFALPQGAARRGSVGHGKPVFALVVCRHLLPKIAAIVLRGGDLQLVLLPLALTGLPDLLHKGLAGEGDPIPLGVKPADRAELELAFAQLVQRPAALLRRAGPDPNRSPPIVDYRDGI